MTNTDEIYDDASLSPKSELLWILEVFIVRELRKMREWGTGSYGWSGLASRRPKASYYKLLGWVVWIGIFISRVYGNFAIRSTGDEAIYWLLICCSWNYTMMIECISKPNSVLILFQKWSIKCLKPHFQYKPDSILSKFYQEYSD